MGNLSVIKQFELKEEALEADIDYFLNENMDHTGFPRVFVVVCKLSCLQTLLYKVISKRLLLFRFPYMAISHGRGDNFQKCSEKNDLKIFLLCHYFVLTGILKPHS